MISIELAHRLRDAGVAWHPRTGDRFTILQAEMTGEVFTISDMMIEAHEFSTGTVLGFNGTTEWALDSVSQEDALWLPLEHQLRELLGGTFVSLASGESEVSGATEQSGASADPAGTGGFVVRMRPPGEDTTQTFGAASAADAYALAVLRLVRLALGTSAG